MSFDRCAAKPEYGLNNSRSGVVWSHSTDSSGDDRTGESGIGDWPTKSSERDSAGRVCGA